MLFALLIVIVGAAVLFHPAGDNAPSSLPNFGGVIALCGLAAGGLGLVAVLRQHERSWLVWLAILSGLFSIALLVRDFLVAF